MARLMPSWRSLPQTGTVSDCAGDTARFAINCSPSSTIPRWQPTTTEANGNCAPPQPIARSPAASVPTGAPTCSPPSAALSELPHAEASTPIRPFARPYAGSPFSNRVEQIRNPLPPIPLVTYQQPVDNLIHTPSRRQNFTVRNCL